MTLEVKTNMADGRPTYDGYTDLKANGQQKDYLVLSDEERAKGFVRPVRLKYKHIKCGTVTQMSHSIAETYARDPSFYSGTFCAGCGTHFNLVSATGDRNFIWDDDSGQGVGE